MDIAKLANLTDLADIVIWNKTKPTINETSENGLNKKVMNNQIPLIRAITHLIRLNLNSQMSFWLFRFAVPSLDPNRENLPRLKFNKLVKHSAKLWPDMWDRKYFPFTKKVPAWSNIGESIHAQKLPLHNKVDATIVLIHLGCDIPSPFLYAAISKP